MMMSELKPIEVLLVEDDPGDELMTREAFEDNKIRNRLHVARDGEEALDFLYRRGEHAERAPARPGPARPQPAQVRRAADPGADQVRPRAVPRAGGHPDHVLVEEDILRSYRLHANAYVTKPVDVDQFIAAVRQIDEFFVSVVQLPRR